MNIIPITDPSDPRLDDFRDLKHSDRRPDRPGVPGLVIAEGPLVVRRLLESRFPVRALVGFESKIESFCADEAVAGLLADVPVMSIDRPTLADVVGYDMHRGLLASADRPAPLEVSAAVGSGDTVVVLEGVGDHENVGAIFRNAAGLDVDAVLLGNGCADPLYRRSVRVSMGHVLRTPFARFDGKYTNWQHGLDLLRQLGFRLVALTPHPAAVSLARALVDSDGAGYDKVAFVVGAEGPGLTEHAMRATDVRARIPMSEGTDSLNVATAAAIAFYERLRLRP